MGIPLNTKIKRQSPLLSTIVSLTNSQSIATRILHPLSFIPKIYIPRLAYGAGISMKESKDIFDSVPSLASKEWTKYWRECGEVFDEKGNFRAATMCYIVGSFPSENRPWKHEINRLKIKSFLNWCGEKNIVHEERFVFTPRGKIRYYLLKPSKNPDRDTPLTIFLNGLEGSAEEFAFPLLEYIKGGMAFAILSVPGSADFEMPMSERSDEDLRYIIDEISKEPWLDHRRLGMAGFSFGAYWTLICAKTDERIKFAVLNGIPFRYSLHFGRTYGLNPIIARALTSVFRLKHPLQLLPIIRRLHKRAESLLNRKSCPILALDGDQDTIVDPRDTEILGTAPGHKLIWLRNDDHCGLFHYDRMVSILVSWTRRCLKELGRQDEGNPVIKSK